MSYTRSVTFGRYVERLFARFYVDAYAKRLHLWGAVAVGLTICNLGIVVSWPTRRGDCHWRIAVGLGLALVEISAWIHPPDPETVGDYEDMEG